MFFGNAYFAVRSYCIRRQSLPVRPLTLNKIPLPLTSRRKCQQIDDRTHDHYFFLCCTVMLHMTPIFSAACKSVFLAFFVVVDCMWMPPPPPPHFLPFSLFAKQAFASCRNGVYSSKWRPAARAEGGGHSQTRGRAGVTEMSESTVSAAWTPVLVLSTIIFYLPVIPRYGHQMCSVFLWETWLENRQKPLRVIFLPSLACRDRSQIIDLDRGSGHRSCTCTVNPKNFFLLLLLCQPFYISRVSLFLFFFSPDSSVAQTLKNVEPLDCKFHLLRRRSIGSKISLSEVMHLLTLNVFPVNFRVVLVVAFFLFLFFSLSLLLSFSFLFSVVTSNFFFLCWNCLGVHLDWDVICSTIDIVVAFKASGNDYARKLLEFSVPTVFKAIEDGVDRAKACLVPLKKNLSLRNVSKPIVSYTGQPANLHRANARIERNVSWWTLGARPLLSKFLPFAMATVLRNPWQGLSLTRSGPVSGHLSIPPRRSWKCIRRPSTLPVSQGTGGSLFPSVRATRSDAVSVRLGNVKLGLDPEKRKPTSHHWSLNREKTFGRRNGLHSFHCMHCALNVSRAFRCPPPFCARTFDE